MDCDLWKGYLPGVHKIWISNSPAYFRGGSSNPHLLGAHIFPQVDFRPKWKYLATRTACALKILSLHWTNGQLERNTHPLFYLDGNLCCILDINNRSLEITATKVILLYFLWKPLTSPREADCSDTDTG